jgi:putative Mg2+ transporter-C (MgtC) family protein
MEVSVISTLLRILIVFTLSFIFGVVRQRNHKHVGFGTYTMVSVGACVLAIAALELSVDNPLPLLSAIVTGIGFLGAGALIRTSDKIFGFTSAAAIWLYAIFGLLVGSGEYLLGVCVYIVSAAVIGYDIYLEDRGIGSYQRRLIVTTNKVIQEKEIKEVLIMIAKKHRLQHVDVNKTEHKMIFNYLVEGSKEQLNKIPKVLYEKEWFESVAVE